jgi:hypothetical protein
MKMINLSNTTAGLVAGLVITSVVPALGATRLNHSARNARAQAIEQSVGVDEGVTAHRAKALRECSEIAGKFIQRSYGVRQLEINGACMAEHGEPE